MFGFLCTTILHRYQKKTDMQRVWDVHPLVFHERCCCLLLLLVLLLFRSSYRTSADTYRTDITIMMVMVMLIQMKKKEEQE